MAHWKQDPQSREDIEEVTKELELPVLKPNALAKLRPFWKESWNKIEDYLMKLKNALNGKEPTINKKSGFNLDKTDSYEEDDTNKLGTARALKRLYDEIVRRIGAIKLTWDSITGKPNISSSVTSTSESDLANSKAVKLANDNANGRVAKTGDNMTGDLIIKGHRAITLKEMAQSLGLEYGDDISEVGEKEVGKAYWHSASKKLYKCIRATTATSPAVDDFLPVDNNSLLDRLENLPDFEWKYLYNKFWNYDRTPIDVPREAREILYINKFTDALTADKITRIDSFNIVPLELLKTGVSFTITDTDSGGDRDSITLKFDKNTYKLNCTYNNANFYLIILWR